MSENFLKTFLNSIKHANSRFQKRFACYSGSHLMKCISYNPYTPPLLIWLTPLLFPALHPLPPPNIFYTTEPYIQLLLWNTFQRRSFSIIRIGPSVRTSVTIRWRLAHFNNLDMSEMNYRFQTLHDESYNS